MSGGQLMIVCSDNWDLTIHIPNNVEPDNMPESQRYTGTVLSRLHDALTCV